MVGYGSIGKRHIENLASRKNIEIIVLTKRKSDKFLKEKNCKVYSSLCDCVKEDPTFAIVSNETRFHIKTALDLAKAGIHMMIEKPLSFSLKDTAKLQRIVSKKKITVLVGCNLRFHPCLQLIRNMILSGDVGRIVSARVENGSFLPDWHPHEIYQNSYAARNDLGGGVVLTCIHEIDYLYWFFGDVRNVFSFTGNFSDLKISSEDLSSIILQFNNKVVAEAHFDYFQRPNVRNCKIIGTKGTLTWDLESNSVQYYDVKKKKWIEKLRLSNFDINQTYIKELDHLIECVQGKAKPTNDLKQGIYTLKIALTVKKSSKLKKTLSIG